MLGGFTPIIDLETGEITGYTTSIGGADTVFPFKKGKNLINAFTSVLYNAGVAYPTITKQIATDKISFVIFINCVGGQNISVNGEDIALTQFGSDNIYFAFIPSGEISVSFLGSAQVGATCTIYSTDFDKVYKIGAEVCNSYAGDGLVSKQVITTSDTIAIVSNSTYAQIHCDGVISAFIPLEFSNESRYMRNIKFTLLPPGTLDINTCGTAQVGTYARVYSLQL